jgi:hypothetical protein
MAAGEDKKNIQALRTFAADAKDLQAAPAANTKLVVPAKEEYPAYENEVETPQDTALTRLQAEAEKIAAPTSESFFAQRGSSTIDSVEDGEIIRETKHKRFRLIPAMIEATAQWATGQKDALASFRRQPNHPIAKAEARKEVIKEAVEKSAIAPKEDFHTVVARLKKVERKPVQTGISLKEKTQMPKPQWSHIADTEGEAKTLPAVPQVMSSAPVTNAPEVSVPTPAPSQRPALSEEPLQTQPPVEVAAKTSTFVPTPQSQKKEAPVMPTPVVVKKQTVPSYTPTPVGNRFLSPVFLTICVVIMATIAGVSASFFIFKKDEGNVIEKVAVYEVPTLIEGNTRAVPLPSDRWMLLEALTSSLQENNTILQLYTTKEEAGVERPASAEETLSVLTPQISGTFGRTIREIAFGGAAQDPFIIMKVTSFDAAFAGMLEWERTMSSDLTPFFGNTVVITFDPSARTDTQVRDAFFKDVIASNKNARVLLDEDGHERIIYTFVDQNTILITKTKETLDVLLPRMR